MGMMNIKYGIICIIFSTIGSCVGTYFIQKLVENTGRVSILIISLAFVLAVSTILIPIHTCIQTINMVKKGIDIWQIKSPC